MRKLLLLFLLLSGLGLQANTAKAFLEDFEKMALTSTSNYDKIAYHFTMAHLHSHTNKETALAHLEEAKKIGSAINVMIAPVIEAKAALIYGDQNAVREKIVEIESKILKGNDFSIGLFYLFLAQNSEKEAPNFNYYWNIGLTRSYLGGSPFLESSFYFLKYEYLKNGMPEMASSFLEAAHLKLGKESNTQNWFSVLLGVLLGISLIALMYFQSESLKVRKSQQKVEEDIANLKMVKNQMLGENEKLQELSNEQSQTIELLKDQLAETRREASGSMGNCSYIQSVLKNNVSKIKEWSNEASEKSELRFRMIASDLHDILDLSNMDSRKNISLQQDRFKLFDFYTSRVERYRQLYNNVHFKYDHFIPKYFNGNLNLFERSVESLIHFGVLFCPQEKIDVLFRLKSFSEDNLNIEIEMQTPPKFFPLEFQKLLRNEFPRELFDQDNYYFAKLFLLKEFARLQHGNFDVIKDHELNNKFILSIPLQAEIVPEQPVLKELEKAQNSLHSLYRVLLVEDNKINQMVVRNMLEKEGYTVEIATNGEEAIHKINEKQFSLILMDIQMPKMDGLRTTEYIRKLENDQKRNVPIIALTGSSFLSEKEKALMFGMNDHIAKPYNPKEILEVVEKHIGSRPSNLGA